MVRVDRQVGSEDRPLAMRPQPLLAGAEHHVVLAAEEVRLFVARRGHVVRLEERLESHARHRPEPTLEARIGRLHVEGLVALFREQLGQTAAEEAGGERARLQ